VRGSTGRCAAALKYDGGDGGFAVIARLLLALVFPATTYWPLLLLLLVDPVVDRLRTGRARAEA
jgi:hypothetical protein